MPQSGPTLNLQFAILEFTHPASRFSPTRPFEPREVCILESVHVSKNRLCPQKSSQLCSHRQPDHEMFDKHPPEGVGCLQNWLWIHQRAKGKSEGLNKLKKNEGREINRSE